MKQRNALHCDADKCPIFIRQTHIYIYIYIFIDVHNIYIHTWNLLDPGTVPHAKHYIWIPANVNHEQEGRKTMRDRSISPSVVFMSRQSKIVDPKKKGPPTPAPRAT